MIEWQESIWGVIALGAVGSILGSIILILAKKYIASIAFSIFSNLLVEYAKNRHFVKECEAIDRNDLILLKYQAVSMKYTRVQVVFVLLMASCFISWYVYTLSDNFPLAYPLIFSFYLIYWLYSFFVWYGAVAGCFPEKMKAIEKEILDKKQKNVVDFLAEVKPVDNSNP